MVRRLYSTFAGGLPGIGLLIMRLVVGAVFVLSTGPKLGSDASVLMTLTGALLGVSGLLLVAGLWTPLAGLVAAAAEALEALTLDGYSAVGLLSGTIAAALAMLGPGRWSVDARLFGWKRIEPPHRRTAHTTAE